MGAMTMRVLTAVLMAAATPIAAEEIPGVVPLFKGQAIVPPTSPEAPSWRWGKAEPDHMPVPVPTKQYQQLPFDHPSWDDEATKKRALERAYGITPAKKFNKIDAGAPDLNMNDIHKFLSRYQKKKIVYNRVYGDDVCEQHGLKKIISKDGTSWRCRK
jgi:hypothetical protein